MLLNYIIFLLDGNELGLFEITRTNDSRGIIRSAGRLDREIYNQHLLTIKCFKASTRNTQLTRKPFNRLVSFVGLNDFINLVER